jgi:hypothetical protein
MIVESKLILRMKRTLSYKKLSCTFSILLFMLELKIAKTLSPKKNHCILSYLLYIIIYLYNFASNEFPLVCFYPAVVTFERWLKNASLFSFSVDLGMQLI